MKGYCTARDVRLALAPLDQFDEMATGARLEDSQIDDGISEAEGIVDLHVAMRYTINVIDVFEPNPDDPGNMIAVRVAPDPLRGVTRSVAAYLITLTHQKSKDMTEDDPIRLRYAMAMDLLRSIRDGKSRLSVDTFPPVSQTGDITVVNLYEPKLFGMSDVGIASAGSDPQVYIPYRRW